MSKFITAIALFGLSVAPAFAGEGNGDPFGHHATLSGAVAQQSVLATADTGSQAYPSFVGRPGFDLPLLAGIVLPSNGQEGEIQTANSLPAGALNGTVAYAQATQVQQWVQAHAKVTAMAAATRATRHTEG